MFAVLLAAALSFIFLRALIPQLRRRLLDEPNARRSGRIAQRLSSSEWLWPPPASSSVPPIVMRIARSPWDLPAARPNHRGRCR